MSKDLKEIRQWFIPGNNPSVAEDEQVKMTGVEVAKGGKKPVKSERQRGARPQETLRQSNQPLLCLKLEGFLEAGHSAAAAEAEAPNCPSGIEDSSGARVLSGSMKMF